MTFSFLKRSPKISPAPKHTPPIAPPSRALWDYLIEPTGRKHAWLCDVSENGCVLRTSEPLDARRWVRLAFHDDAHGLTRARSGLVLRREDRIEAVGDELAPAITLHRYTIAF